MRASLSSYGLPHWGPTPAGSHFHTPVHPVGVARRLAERTRSALAFPALVLIRIMLQGWDAAAVLTRLGSRRPAQGVSLLGAVARVTAMFTAQRPGYVRRLRAWLAPPWPWRPLPFPSVVRPGPHPILPARERLPVDLDEDDVVRPRRGFTQIADATDPVRGLTPCQRPPAGRRSRRLVVCSRLHASKPSFERTVTISSGVPAQPCSCSIHVIRPCSPRALKPVIVRIMVPCA